MSPLLDDIKSLLRGWDGLSENGWASQVDHCATEVLRRLQQGDTVRSVEQYLQHIHTRGAGQLQIQPATHQLVRRVFALVDAPLA